MSSDGGTALVTGASSGIGAATARSLADAGFEVVAAARHLERCEAVAEAVGGRALRLDVTDPDSVAALANELPEPGANGCRPHRRGRLGRGRRGLPRGRWIHGGQPRRQRRG